jgi:hypothetical protein
MSTRVRERLAQMQLLEQTNHEERVILDQLIEMETGGFCDSTVSQLSDDKVRSLLAEAKRRAKKDHATEEELVELQHVEAYQ